MELHSLYLGKCPASDYDQYMEFINLVFRFEPGPKAVFCIYCPSSISPAITPVKMRLS